MNLSQIQREIFAKNAKLRGEGMKKKKATKKKATKKTTTKKGGIAIGGKKKLPAGARAWLDLVKQVYASGNMSWKQALQEASKIYKKM